ncbi:MAG: dephospho-CoA kinase [Oscillospiraceae bacterium]|nr:dephospho-CoA kinase [Oscillospiraceae bacterium]
MYKKKIIFIIKNSTYQNIIIDAPLLIECGLNDICDKVISILSDRDIRLSRIQQRDDLPLFMCENRLNAQKDVEFYIKNSTIAIYNNGTLKDFYERLKKIIDIF